MARAAGRRRSAVAHARPRHRDAGAGRASVDLRARPDAARAVRAVGTGAPGACGGRRGLSRVSRRERPADRARRRRAGAGRCRAGRDRAECNGSRRGPRGVVRRRGVARSRIGSSSSWRRCTRIGRACSRRRRACRSGSISSKRRCQTVARAGSIGSALLTPPAGCRRARRHCR